MMAASSAGTCETYYTKHKKKKFNDVVCIICDAVYQKQDLVDMKNVKFVSKVLIVCENHDLNEITSKSENTVMSTEAKSIIAMMKEYKIDELKKLMVHEINSEILSTTNDHNKSIFCADSELNHLTIENKLLRDLNRELKTINNLLVEKRDSESGKNINISSSYASIAANNKVNTKKKT